MWPQNLDKAKVQFAQAKPMLEAFRSYFGEHLFEKDGFKLIEVPYSGMEHQSAVTYGNGFVNGYLNRDWTGIGISLKFDHRSRERPRIGWQRGLGRGCVRHVDPRGMDDLPRKPYVEKLFGHDDAIRYVNSYKSKVQNREPIVTQRGIHRQPQQDMYFKGTLFLNTLRSVVNDDAIWWGLVRDVYQQFKYRTS